MKAINTAGNALNSTVEQAREHMPNAAAIRQKASQTIHEAYDSLRGSGSIVQEIKKPFQNTFVNVPKEAFNSTFDATMNLVTLHPIESAKTLTHGMTKVMSNITQAAISPIPISLAATGTTLYLAWQGAKLPVTIPLKGFSIAKNGCAQAMKLLEDKPKPAGNQKAPTPLPPSPTESKRQAAEMSAPANDSAKPEAEEKQKEDLPKAA
jgi:hypothetical protein